MIRLEPGSRTGNPNWELESGIRNRKLTLELGSGTGNWNRDLGTGTGLKKLETGKLITGMCLTLKNEHMGAVTGGRAASPSKGTCGAGGWA